MTDCQFTHHRPRAIYMFLIVIGAAFAIILYGSYRCHTPSFEDPFTQSVIEKYPWNRFIDGWGLLHFWFFMWLGYHYPNCWKEIVGVGVLWEVIESIFKDHPFYLTECDVSKGGWWYGRWEDIVMNSLGLCAGLALREKNMPRSVPILVLIIIVLLQVSLQQYREKIKNCSTDNKQK